MNEKSEGLSDKGEGSVPVVVASLTGKHAPVTYVEGSYPSAIPQLRVVPGSILACSKVCMLVDIVQLECQ